MNNSDQPQHPPDEEAPTDPPPAVRWMMQQAAAGTSQASLPVDLEDLAVPALAPESIEVKLAAREQRMAESLRGNERLTEGLDGEAAEALLDLGLQMSRDVVRDTAGLDDVAAEDILQPRMRAVRRLMMAAARAITPAGGGDSPQDLFEQAAVALGDQFSSPDEDEQATFRRQWRELAGRPPDQVAALRRFIEDRTNRPA